MSCYLCTRAAWRRREPCSSREAPSTTRSPSPRPRRKRTGRWADHGRGPPDRRRGRARQRGRARRRRPRAAAEVAAGSAGGRRNREASRLRGGGAVAVAVRMGKVARGLVGQGGVGLGRWSVACEGGVWRGEVWCATCSFASGAVWSGDWCGLDMGRSWWSPAALWAVSPEAGILSLGQAVYAAFF